MAVLPIKQAGEPILRQKAQPVKKIDRTIHRLLDDMLQTMDAADGVGLAAPQVGIALRVVVIDVGDGPLELINPEIVACDGQERGQEGCLSVTGFYGDVDRYAHVRVEALNRHGKRFSVSGEGLLARALQHEIDHLEGILFIDKAITLTKQANKE